MSAITVIKLGGSLCRDAHASTLRDWLAALARRAAADRHRQWLVVPGGGGFADAVRDAQAQWRFDDLAAHNMAVLAMEQTARLMVALGAGLALAGDIAAVRAAWAAGRLPVWGGRDALRTVPDRLTRWEVSSDSLAAWIAGELHADRLVLVKHGVGAIGDDARRPAVAEAPGLAPAFARRLAHDGVADVALPAFVADAGVALAVWPAERPELALAGVPPSPASAVSARPPATPAWRSPAATGADDALPPTSRSAAPTGPRS
ncbi:hypothetical protein [Derxia gummosa]|uniref:Aspartate/glutamate/uridylate kinase domain-containing protein n=1 Tax=Derxia gummosa DSM 723 TaxID=1121388 RepID=A0A8B6X9Q0_9BURK|nr:hypothetical protein [Derxia gummosa]